MGCGESKLAVAITDTITKSKSSNPTKNESTTTAPPPYDDGTGPETLNGIENAPNGEKKDYQNGEIIKDAEQAPEENNDNVKEDGRTTEGTVVAEGKDDGGTKEETEEKNVDNQETITEKTSSNVDADATKNGSTEEIKEEGSINQNNEGTPKEENIPKAENIVAEEGKEDSKAN